MAALARFSEEDACWWLDASATLTVLRKDDDSHPLYRIVISSAPDAEERRFLQSDFVKFSKLRDAQKTVERVLAPRCAFPPSYAKSRFGASLSRKELEKRTGLLEDYLAGALRSTASSDDPPAEADRSALLEALRLAEVDEVDEAAVADAARRRAESFSSDGSGDRRMVKSFSTAARGSARLAEEDNRPKSETAASAAAKKRGLGSARFSLSGFAKRESEVGGADEHCLAHLASGPVGVAFAPDKWPPTVSAVTDARLNVRPGDVVTKATVRDEGKVVETDCALLTGDQLELILAADDHAKGRVLHVQKARAAEARGSTKVKGLWGSALRKTALVAALKKK